METISFARNSKEENDKWVSSSSKLSINSNTSVYDQNPSFQLHLKQKREYKGKRPIIESTKNQRLSFYRAYTTSIYKTETMCQHSSQFNWLQIFVDNSILFEVITYIDTLRLMFHYFFNGLLFQNPWNRCRNATYYDVDLKEKVHCYEWDDFVKRFMNASLINQFSGHTYKSPNNESFQVAPIEYFRLNIGPKVFWRDFAYSVFIWFLVAFLTCYVSKKYFWKVADIDMLAESTTAPPVAHILTARSTQPIKPSKDSTIIILSNAAIYLFRGLLSKKIILYCEYMLKAPIYFSEINDNSFFFIRPIFYSSFYLGDLYILGFFGLNLITEILTATVVLRCVIDTVFYEWTKLKKPWIIHIVIFILAILLYTTTGYKSRLISYVYSKGFATLCETVFLYMLYPLQRFIDDYKFHYGVSLPILRKMSLQLVPFYYMVKFAIMMDALFEMLGSPDSHINVPHHKWSWSLTLLPLLLGMAFMAYKYIFIHRGTWNLIFRPVPNWGPREIYLRQLRKQYDSRHYIKSAVSRQLSRYFISKAEFKVYKIDVRYDFYRKYTTIPKEIRFGDDKKDT